MARAAVVLLIGCVALGAGLACGEVEAGRRGDGVGVWWSPDSTWGMRMGEVLGRERLGHLLESRPEKFGGLLMLEILARDEGEWFWIRVRLAKVERVTFTNRTKIVVTDREGKRVESEAVFFWPDKEQSALYDSRKGPVVVSNSSVWRGMDGLSPTGCVKFRAGSVRVGDIRSFEVVGAVEQRGDGEAR